MAVVGGPDEIVTDGLVLHLDAANPDSYPGTGTTWNDLSGNGNNGTLTNGPTFNGDNAGSIVFDGTNDYVEISTITSTIEKTYCIWAIVPASGEQQVFSAGDTSSTCVGLTFNSTRNGNSQVVTSDLLYGTVTNGNSFGVGSGVTVNTWHNFIITTNSNGNVTALYIDGISTPSRTELSRVYSNETLIRIADRSNGDYTYTGNVAQVSIYNRALSAQEILQNYNATKERFTNK